VVSLIAKSPLADYAPVTHGACTLAEVVLDHVTSIAPFNGQEKATTAALKAAHGVTFPQPNRFVEKAGVRAVWSGRGQAFVIGAPVVMPEDVAACADQSDAWACLRIKGAAAEAVLARLVPIDIRAAVMPKGHAAREPLGHMMSVVLRTAADTFEVMVFRSMAQTAWHEVERAMRSVAARV
jgi:heterotetrameric sarcosine oxidase gamma subunit